MNEELRYRVAYGALDVGEVHLSILGYGLGLGAGQARQVVRARGYGAGAILGFARHENRIDAEFDARQLWSRRWTHQRTNDAGVGMIRDVADQPRQGEVRMVRERPGAPTERVRAQLPGPTLDPVGFLLRVRVAPPPLGSTPQVLQLLDGRALWRVTLSNAGRQPVPDAPDAGAGGPPARAIRIEGRADPVRYSGAPDVDGDRVRRDFVLWLSEDPSHVPLRLEMPLGIGDLVVALVDATRHPR